MSRLVVLLTAVLAAAFVLASGASLPATVVSHFDASGQPDGTAAKRGFLVGMASITSVLPLFVWWMQVRSIRSGKVRIPNRDYWFAAGRRPSSERWLRGHAACFSVATTLFLCFVFWLVVRANAQGAAARLDGSLFWPALVAYVGVALAWALAPRLRFRDRDR